MSNYPITQGTLAAANYTITFVTGSLSVTPAPLTVTASSPSKVYGAALPALTFSAATLVNGDTAATALTGALATTATAASPVANYPITQGTLAAKNYTITLVPGTLSVTPAPLIITADSKTKTAGAANPPLTFTAMTFVNGDTAASLTTQPTLSTTATVASPVGSYPITPSGAADPNYSISYVSGTLSVTAGVTTSTALSASLSTSTFGQNVTFTAVVNPSGSASGRSLPTGSVTFLDGTTVLGTGTLKSAQNHATATFSTSSLAVGSHSITAVYQGSNTYAGSTSNSSTEKVKQASTNTSLSSNDRTGVAGQTIIFTATIAVVSPGSGIPTGTVTFKDGNTVLGAGTNSVAGGRLQTTFSINSLSIGTHSITATYGGDADFGDSKSSSVTEVVSKSATTTALHASVNPAAAGTPLTLTAQVTANAPGSGNPTGTVTFRDGTRTIGTGTLGVVGGITEATITLSNLTVGQHVFTAVYAGSSNYVGSISNTLHETVTAAHLTVAAADAAFDVNGDGAVTPLDVLAIIDQLNAHSGLTGAALAPFDVNNDGLLSPLDALAVIDYLDNAATSQPAVAASVASSVVPTATSAPTSNEAIAFAMSVVPAGQSNSMSSQSVDAVFGSYPNSVNRSRGARTAG